MTKYFHFSDNCLNLFMNTMQNNTFIGEDRGGAALWISFHLASLRDRNLPRRRIRLDYTCLYSR